MSLTKEKMIAGAADLISRRGVCATSLRDVVQHTGTPRGSLTHYFPGGKPQMLEEALRYATEAVAEPLQALMNEKGPIDGLQAFVGWWRRVLETSNFEAGCPVLAVAVEPLTDADESADRLRELASAAFMRWQSVLVEALHREGVPTERAQRLGVLVVASIEGAVAMCRASRSLGPLDDVYREIEYLLENVIRPT